MIPEEDKEDEAGSKTNFFKNGPSSSGLNFPVNFDINNKGSSSFVSESNKNQLPLASQEYHTLVELLVFQIELPLRGMAKAKEMLE